MASKTNTQSSKLSREHYRELSPDETAKREDYFATNGPTPEAQKALDEERGDEPEAGRVHGVHEEPVRRQHAEPSRGRRGR